jgi:CDP-diacylglycerol--glycerol-3-phosphate 3-phosphatidyltransferase
MVIKTKDLLLPPNLLAIARILLLPFIFYFLARDTQLSFCIAIVLMGIAIATDVLDGYLARRLNQVTDLGKILDPVADKLGLGMFVVFVIIHRGFPIWTAVLLFLKDIFTIIAGIMLVKKRGLVPISAYWGKLNSWIWVITVIVFILKIHPLEPWFLAAATISVIYSAILYSRTFIISYRSNN